MSLSVIIPVLNEVHGLEHLLPQLIPMKDIPVPFLSLLRDRLSSSDSLKDKFLPVWANFIYYVNNVLTGLDTILDPS